MLTLQPIQKKTLEVGKNILKEMQGKTPTEHTFKRKNQIVSKGARLAVKIGNENVHIS